MRNNGFCTNVDAFTSYGMSGAACGGTLAGLRCGRLRPARLEESNNGDCKSFARTGCDRPTSTTLLCHSERSGSTNAASAEAACGLCRARRRKTNEVQSNICILTIQILRRSAPQNDKTRRTAIRTTRWNQTIHCSQTPQQTGISNWRQRGKVEGKDVRSGHGLQR